MVLSNSFQKCVVVLILIFVNLNGYTQSKYYSKTGTIQFEASVPSFEEVFAVNNTVSVLLNSENGEIAVLALVKGFRFKVALMEEHFNESYAESSTFPKASFKGVIKDFDLSTIKELKSEFEINGELTFHGKTKKISESVLLSKSANKVKLTMEMLIDPEDFDIQIPKLLRKKVAEKVHVSIELILKPK